MAAYWLLAIMFILLSLGFAMIVSARAKSLGYSPKTVFGIAITPVLLGAGAGIEGHPGWALIISGAAILFSLWWLNNLAKRE